MRSISAVRRPRGAFSVLGGIQGTALDRNVLRARSEGPER